MATPRRYRIETRIRAEVYRRLIAGDTTTTISESLGVSMTSVKRWAKLAGMKLFRGRHGGIPVHQLEDPAHKNERSYRRLTLADRLLIELGRSQAWSIRRIATHVGVAPSTISRELQRHEIEGSDQRSKTRGGIHYYGEVAHYRAVRTRQLPRPKKLENTDLRAVVVAGLNEKCSPQQVAGRLRKEFPTDPEMHVSHETIYQALYVQGKGTLRHELTVEKALRSGRTGRVPKSKLPRKSNRPWLEGARLSDRPTEAADRAVPGHWEGDLVVGPNNSGIVTLVERQTRFALIGRLPGCRDSATVIEVLQDMVGGLPESLLRTITWDQGSEMAEHARFTVATRCPVYFCDPHSPWQRGTNENTNGLVRDFYPKGTDFNQVSDVDLAEMQRLLNIRPRATLDFWTPGEKLEALITGVALAP